MYCGAVWEQESQALIAVWKAQKEVWRPNLEDPLLASAAAVPQT